MKIVAVSQRVDVYPDRNERRDALDQRLITFLSVAGFVPVPVPNGSIPKPCCSRAATTLAVAGNVI